MASTEHLLISKIIQVGQITVPLEAGLRTEHFSKEWAPIWDWIVEYFGTYSAVPTARVFKQQYGDLSLKNAENEPFAALIDELYRSYKHKKIVEVINSVAPMLSDVDNVDNALGELTKGVHEASLETARLRDVDLIESWESRLAKYEEMRNTPNALRGIPTGFLGLDKITAGIRPQQLITFVGEAKKGKSMITLIMAEAAHAHGLVPMFVSFEMSIEEQASRYDSLISGVSYTNILRGSMTIKEMEQLEKSLKIRRNMQPFMMTEDTSSLTTVGALASKVQKQRPDILFVDGVYLMDDENKEPKGSSQALTNITRSLKRMAQTLNIPIIGTTQVLSWKLGNKKSRQVTADAIGYSSSFVQDSDVVLGVESDPDIDNQSIIRVLLARAAPKGEVRIKWDWKNMDFKEVDEEENDSDTDNWYY